MPEIQPQKEENVVEDQRLRMNLAKRGDHQHKAKLNSLEWVFGFGFVGGGLRHSRVAGTNQRSVFGVG